MLVDADGWTLRRRGSRRPHTVVLREGHNRLPVPLYNVVGFRALHFAVPDTVEHVGSHNDLLWQDGREIRIPYGDYTPQSLAEALQQALRDVTATVTASKRLELTSANATEITASHNTLGFVGTIALEPGVPTELPARPNLTRPRFLTLRCPQLEQHSSFLGMDGWPGLTLLDRESFRETVETTFNAPVPRLDEVDLTLQHNAHRVGMPTDYDHGGLGFVVVAQFFCLHFDVFDEDPEINNETESEED